MERRVVSHRYYEDNQERFLIEEGPDLFQDCMRRVLSLEVRSRR